MYHSIYFTFYELCKSDTAEKKGINNFPHSWQDVENLNCLASHLDKLRSKVNSPIKVNSGFRSKELNDFLRSNGYNSSLTSFHLRGKAADIVCFGKPFDFFARIVVQYIGFPDIVDSINHYENDNFEVILYPSKGFIHFAFKKWLV